MMKHRTFHVFAAVSLGCILSGCAWFGGSSHPFKDQQLENSFRLDRKKQMDGKAFEEALQGGANPNLEMKNGATPLIMAVLRNRPDLVSSLLKAGAEVNRPGKRGSTPLHAAAALGRKKCLDLLLQAGADVNVHGALGRTPLMDAARMGQLETMTELIDSGADVNDRDSKNRTPLMHAADAQRKSLEAARLLISYGADSLLHDSDLKTAAMHAAEMKHTETALYLIDLIPDLPKHPEHSMMILFYAIKGNDLKVMEKLIDQRLPLNRNLSLILKGTRILQVHGFYRILIRNGLLGHGRVPLHWAAIENNLPAVKLLIEHGADPNQPDELGHTPDELSTSREVIQFIRKLQETDEDD